MMAPPPLTLVRALPEGIHPPIEPFSVHVERVPLRLSR
jgi:hypothetical protein